MTTTIDDTTAGAARHGWIDQLCARLEATIVGQGAAELLEAGPVLGEDVALYRAPVWRWLPPAIDMGRKTMREDGKQMLMPVRTTWDHGHLVLHDPATGPHPQLTWSMEGLGHSATGTVDTADPRSAARAGVVVVARGRRAVSRALARLVEDGRRGRWDALMSLERHVQRAVHTAVASVSWDVSGDTGQDRPAWVLDETAKQAVTDRMLLGTEESPGRAQMLLERCLRPGAFVKVDPLKYVVTDLKRSAEEEVRRTIGDPRIGRKIRSVSRSMPGASIAEVVAAYRQLHPGDRLSSERAISALTAGPDVMARLTSEATPERVSVESHEDAVISQVDSVSVRAA